MAKNLEIARLLDFYAPVLTEKQSEVLHLYYNEDLSLAEIASGCGITRQGVRDAIKRGEAVMLDLEDKLRFAEWYKRLSDASDEIRARALAIRAFNDKNGVFNETSECADRIIELLTTLTAE